MKKTLFTAAVALAAIASAAQSANAQFFRFGYGWRGWSGGRCATNCRYSACNGSAYQRTTYGLPGDGCSAQEGACAPTSAAPDCASGNCQAQQRSCAGDACAWREYKPVLNEQGEIVKEPVKEIGKGRRICTLLQRVNATRARYGLAALANDATLETGSYYQASYCAQIGGLAHGAGAAEILAMNGSGIEAALAQWLNSPAHRALLLNGGYRYAGVAVVRDRYGRVWCAVRFR